MNVYWILSDGFFYIYWHVFLLSINTHFPLYIALTIGEFVILFTRFSLPIPSKGLYICAHWHVTCYCYDNWEKNFALVQVNVLIIASSRGPQPGAELKLGAEPWLTYSLHEARDKETVFSHWDWRIVCAAKLTKGTLLNNVCSTVFLLPLFYKNFAN